MYAIALIGQPSEPIMNYNILKHSKVLNIQCTFKKLFIHKIVLSLYIMYFAHVQWNYRVSSDGRFCCSRRHSFNKGRLFLHAADVSQTICHE